MVHTILEIKKHSVTWKLIWIPQLTFHIFWSTVSETYDIIITLWLLNNVIPAESYVIYKNAFFSYLPFYVVTFLLSIIIVNINFISDLSISFYQTFLLTCLFLFWQKMQSDAVSLDIPTDYSSHTCIQHSWTADIQLLISFLIHVFSMMTHSLWCLLNSVAHAGICSDHSTEIGGCSWLIGTQQLFGLNFSQILFQWQWCLAFIVSYDGMAAWLCPVMTGIQKFHAFSSPGLNEQMPNSYIHFPITEDNHSHTTSKTVRAFGNQLLLNLCLCDYTVYQVGRDTGIPASDFLSALSETFLYHCLYH